MGRQAPRRAAADGLPHLDDHLPDPDVPLPLPVRRLASKDGTIDLGPVIWVLPGRRFRLVRIQSELWNKEIQEVRGLVAWYLVGTSPEHLLFSSWHGYYPDSVEPGSLPVAWGKRSRFGQRLKD